MFPPMSPTFRSAESIIRSGRKSFESRPFFGAVMNRLMFTAPALALSILLAQTASAQVRPAAPSAPTSEPEPVQLLRIEMRKALLAQDSAPKVTAARTAKLKALQAVENPARS